MEQILKVWLDIRDQEKSVSECDGCYIDEAALIQLDIEQFPNSVPERKIKTIEFEPEPENTKLADVKQTENNEKINDNEKVESDEGDEGEESEEEVMKVCQSLCNYSIIVDS